MSLIRSLSYWAAALVVALIICLWFLVFAVTAAPVVGTSVRTSARKTKVRNQVRDVAALKHVMVAVIALETAHPDVANSTEVGALRESAGDLVILFDGVDDLQALKTLISLRSYYFGEGPGEVFDCLLLEKGKQILPLLRAAQDNECTHRFGQKASQERTSNVPLTCLTDSQLRDALNSIAQGIRNGEVCSLKEFY